MMKERSRCSALEGRGVKSGEGPSSTRDPRSPWLVAASLQSLPPSSGSLSCGSPSLLSSYQDTCHGIQDPGRHSRMVSP